MVLMVKKIIRVPLVGSCSSLRTIRSRHVGKILSMPIWGIFSRKIETILPNDVARCKIDSQENIPLGYTVCPGKGIRYILRKVLCDSAKFSRSTNFCT